METALELVESWIRQPALCKVSYNLAHSFPRENRTKTRQRAVPIIDIQTDRNWYKSYPDVRIWNNLTHPSNVQTIIKLEFYLNWRSNTKQAVATKFEKWYTIKYHFIYFSRFEKSFTCYLKSLAKLFGCSEDLVVRVCQVSWCALSFSHNDVNSVLVALHTPLDTFV